MIHSEKLSDRRLLCRGAATLLKFYRTQNKTQHWKEQTKLNKLWNNDSQNQRTKNCKVPSF